MFKTPSLREVDQTAPYMHDGSDGDFRRMLWIIMPADSRNARLYSDYSSGISGYQMMKKQ